MTHIVTEVLEVAELLDVMVYIGEGSILVSRGKGTLSTPASNERTLLYTFVNKYISAS